MFGTLYTEETEDQRTENTETKERVQKKANSVATNANQYEVELKLPFDGYLYTISLSADGTKSCKAIMKEAHEKLKDKFQLDLGNDWIKRTKVYLIQQGDDHIDDDYEPSFSRSHRSDTNSLTVTKAANAKPMSMLSKQTTKRNLIGGINLGVPNAKNKRRDRPNQKDTQHEITKKQLKTGIGQISSEYQGNNRKVHLKCKYYPAEIVVTALYDGDLKHLTIKSSKEAGKDCEEFAIPKIPKSACDELWFVPSAQRQADAPYAVIRVIADEELESNTVKFDASHCRDGKGDECSEFKWDFGDGTKPEKGPTVQHTFKEFGIYSVKCRVIDSARNMAMCSLQQIIGRKQNNDYLSVKSSVFEAVPNEMVIFYASGQNAEGLNYRWYFGDGKETNSDIPRIAHIFKETGSFSVRVEVSELNENGQRTLKKSATLQQRVCSANPDRPSAVITIASQSGGKPESDSKGQMAEMEENNGDTQEDEEQQYSQKDAPDDVNNVSMNSNEPETVIESKDIMDSRGDNDDDEHDESVPNGKMAKLARLDDFEENKEEETYQGDIDENTERLLKMVLNDEITSLKQQNANLPLSPDVFDTNLDANTSQLLQDLLALRKGIKVMHEKYTGELKQQRRNWENDLLQSQTEIESKKDGFVSVTFDASKSMDKRGTPCKWFRFDFGDGSDIKESEDPKVTHPYKAEGTYLVTVVVTDGGGNRSSASLTHKIEKNDQSDGNSGKLSSLTKGFGGNKNKSDIISDGTFQCLITPQIQCARPLSTVGQLVSFWVPDRDEEKVQYQWDFGDESDPGEESNVEHIYKKPGSYSITVSIVDNKRKGPKRAVCTHCVLPLSKQYQHIAYMKSRVLKKRSHGILEDASKQQVKGQVFKFACELWPNDIDQKKEITLMGALFQKLTKSNVVQSATVQKLKGYLDENLYDSDCVEMDIEHAEDSNIHEALQNEEAIEMMADLIRINSMLCPYPFSMFPFVCSS